MDVRRGAALRAGQVQIELKVITGIYFKLTESGVVFGAMGGTWILGVFLIYDWKYLKSTFCFAEE